MNTPPQTLPLVLLLSLAWLLPLHGADALLTFADSKPQRYEFSARASEIDPRARPHPEIDFVFEKDGKPADVEHTYANMKSSFILQ